MDLSFIVISLMPSQSTAPFKSEVQRSIVNSIHSCAIILDKHCKEKHQPHLKDKHACQIEIMATVKTPVLSMPMNLITQVSAENGRAMLEKNPDYWVPITQGINLHYCMVRTIKLRDYITIHTDNWLRYYRTPAGDVGNAENSHLLTLLASAPRAQLVTQLVGMGCRKKKEVKKGPRYNNFVATGESTFPKEDDRDRSRRPLPFPLKTCRMHAPAMVAGMTATTALPGERSPMAGIGLVIEPEAAQGIGMTSGTS